MESLSRAANVLDSSSHDGGLVNETVVEVAVECTVDDDDDDDSLAPNGNMKASLMPVDNVARSVETCRLETMAGATSAMINDSVSHLQPYLLSTQLYPQQTKTSTSSINKQ